MRVAGVPDATTSATPRPWECRGEPVVLGLASGERGAVCSRRGKEETPLSGQGEAGAERRVRVGCVVGRCSSPHLTRTLSAPAPGGGEGSRFLGAE